MPVEGNGRKIKNKDEDEDYYAIKAYDENGNKIDVFTARFFGGSDIEKITKAFRIDTVKKLKYYCGKLLDLKKLILVGDK